MIVYSLLTVSLLIALWSTILAWKGTRKGFNDGWTTIGAALALGLFAYLYGSWVYITIYLKYAFGILFLIVLFTGIFKGKVNVQRASLMGIVLNIICMILFGGLSVLYFTGTTGKPEKVELAFPLKKGSYFVLQGGKGLPTNLFHYGLRGAIYAMDIVKLNSYGGRAKKVFSERLEDYEIFGDMVYSPCDGIIQKAVSDDTDNIPPHRDRGPNNTNQVLIEADSFYVFIGHLKHGSTFVKAGDVVKRGQPIALVGNSGFSLEPHLHIQVHGKTADGAPWYRGRPLYIEFDGRSYLMNEVIKN